MKNFVVVTKIRPNVWKIVDLYINRPVVPFVIDEEIPESLLDNIPNMFGYLTFRVDEKIAKIAKVVYLKRRKKLK